MSFDHLGLIEPLRRAVREDGYTEPTPIQQQAIPPLLEGRDLLGCAQTGTGKTAAFALPMIQKLSVDRPQGEDRPPNGRRCGKKGKPSRPIRALVLAPTRELAAQVGESFRTYGRHTGVRSTVVFGGVKQGRQVKQLCAGVDVLVATPGRLLDLEGQGHLRLDRVEIFVLDEADRMLDMGFMPDVRRILGKLPEKRQSMMFSATIPPHIRRIADSVCTDPVEIRIATESPEADTVDQRAYFVERGDKRALLEHLLENEPVTRALVFARTKRGADRLARSLAKGGRIRAQAMHSDRSQAEREKALADFKSGKTRVLVASDIAARGIDVDDISHVVNYDLPRDPETYIHRIGRTGRAGATGFAFSFCALDERGHLRDIERLLGKPVPPAEDHPFASDLPHVPPEGPLKVYSSRRRKSGRSRVRFGVRG